MSQPFLTGGCVFNANVDKGMVTPEDMGDAQTWLPGAEFSGFHVPLKKECDASASGTAVGDWTKYPRYTGVNFQ